MGGLGAAATVAGCSGGGPTAANATGARTSATTTAAATSTSAAPLDWGALRDRLGGALLQSGSPDFGAAIRLKNPIFDKRNPAGLALCGSAEHVQACVEFARQAKIPIAARSGGHSYAGYSAPDGGLIVDVGRMASVEVRTDGTAVIGAGARLIDVYTALAAKGRCLPAGTCPTVGVAGLALGGGLGVFTRKFGLTCDRLVSAQIVTADSVLRPASPSNEPDLFWALRGGGGGNFGVVTSFTFTTEPAPDVTVFHLSYPAAAAAAVVAAWQGWATAVPDELWSAVAVNGDAAKGAALSGCFIGTPANLNPLLEQFTKQAGKPKSRLVQQKGYLEAMRYFAGCTQKGGDCPPPNQPRNAFVASSRVITAPLDAQGLVATLDGRPDMTLLLDALGGAVAKFGPEETAFPHRKALGTVQIYLNTKVTDVEAANRSVAEVRDALARLGARGGYVNYIEAAMPDWGPAYYGQNLSRLDSVVRRYDPDAVFTFPQSIHRT
ncbi:FAD-binding oxidoreductase [Actinokineospora auranticolor]|uniref:FAD-binding oxidoreductase n=1 Tax=Actinokineospora auranticolor TaxID=155976 RepID=UPI001FE994AE|nr:FAD-binding oxidoreductase [Actinokineospora auranticolor]